MITRKQRIVSLLLAIVMLLSLWLLPNEKVFAGTALPGISSSRYISTYTYASSGKAYAYKDASLSGKTGGYIACATDECRILEISGKAVKVSYPISGGRRTAWFEREKFTYRDLAGEGAKLRFKSTKKVTTYKWKNKNDTFGYIASGDICYLLRGDAASDWLQVIYPTGSTYKMAWVKGNDIKSVIWPANATVKVNGVSFSMSSVELTAGSSTTLSAAVKPSNASNKNVSWSSSNSPVASVNSSGKVMANKKGTATITVRTSDGGYTASAKVTVIEKTAAISLKVPVFRQYDRTWSNVKIGTKTIGQIGCTTTCIAMKYSYQTGKKVTPDKMKKKLSYSNNDIIWSSVTKLGYSLTSPYKTRINQSIMKTIYKQLKKGRPVIIGGIPSASSSNQHWIVVTGYKGSGTGTFKASDFAIIDPNSSSRKTLAAFLSYKPYVYRMIY